MQKANLIGLPVEVSGWDPEGRFFVEHSTLEIDEQGHKAVLLHRCVSNRTLLFIRARHGDIFARRHPEAYYVETMKSSECLDAKKLTLVDLPSHRNGRDEPESPAAHPINVRDEVNP